MKNLNTQQGNETINVHELHLPHPKLRAEDFRSPLVRRLSQTDRYQDGHTSLNNSYRGVDGIITDSTLMLQWKGLAEDHRKCLNTYQVPVITEYATLGLACILLTRNTSQEITEVTRRGEKADYWIGDREAMMEISGQQDGDITELCERKSGQLLENPYGQNGYVCVAIFDNRQARLWYYDQSGATT
jgi:hypothetical protein